VSLFPTVADHISHELPDINLAILSYSSQERFIMGWVSGCPKDL
jgi:hypothetical protein